MAAPGPLLGANAAVGPGGIHKAEHRAVKLLRLAHETKGLSIPLRVGRPEETAHPLLGAVPLFNGHEGHRNPPEVAHAPHNGGIVGIAPVPVEL